jgi:hypothetical protein
MGAHLPSFFIVNERTIVAAIRTDPWSRNLAAWCMRKPVRTCRFASTWMRRHTLTKSLMMTEVESFP